MPKSAKLRSFTYFGHGGAGSLAPGWNNSANTQEDDWSFMSSDLELLYEGAISKQCRCVSYACNTAAGTGSDGKGASFAGKWKASFGVVLHGVNGKTSYKPCGLSIKPWYKPGLPVLADPPEGGSPPAWVPSPPPPVR